MNKKTEAKKFYKNSLCDETMSKKKLYTIIGVVSVVLISAMSYGAILLFSEKFVPPDASSKDAANFVASDKFNDLSLQERMDYLRNMGGGKRFNPRDISEADRKKFMENARKVREAQMKKKMNDFFKMSKEDQQKQLLADIAKMKDMRDKRAENRENSENKGENKGGNNGGNDGKSSQRPQPTAQDQRDREASKDPVTSAQSQVYRQMLRNAMGK